MKTAIIHDWLIDIGGAEKCLGSIYSLYPSDLYTLIFKEQSALFLGIDPQSIKTSFVQRLPYAARNYRKYLPVFPYAVEQFDLSGYDLIISSSHSVSKGILTNANQLHICYCHTPMRYAWDFCHQSFRAAGLDRGLKGVLAGITMHYIRMWDCDSSKRVDYFIANSKFIAKRIKKIYGRNSTLIYPPVDIQMFSLCTEKEDFYLTASRMVPYKRVDLIVDAFAELPDKKLVVIGGGPEFRRISSKARGNIKFLGQQSTGALKSYMQRAKAFVFAAEEDFGITPVEAQACGTPVIAFGRGGVLETVVENRTGIFFSEQSKLSLINAINTFERDQTSFDHYEIRKNAERFSKERFEREFKTCVEKKTAEFRALKHWQQG